MKKIIHVSVVLGCLSYALCAHSSLTSGRWFVGGNVGASIPEITHNQFVGTGSGWPDDRYHLNHLKNVADFSILAGYQWVQENPFIPFFSLSTRYTDTTSVKVRGTIYQYNLPQFGNYIYHYYIQRQTALGVAKATLFKAYRVMPFVTAGLGVTVNKVKNYSETPLPTIDPRTSPEFQNKSHSELGYIVGAGVDFALTTQVWVGLEYHYGHYGNVQSGYGVGGFAAEHLKSKFMDNAVAFSINCFFDHAA